MPPLTLTTLTLKDDYNPIVELDKIKILKDDIISPITEPTEFLSPID